MRFALAGWATENAPAAVNIRKQRIPERISVFISNLRFAIDAGDY